jgi:phosphatidylethanolamine/phosphatidyl-N-methylethanolamine N-methyltransferase
LQAVPATGVTLRIQTRLNAIGYDLERGMASNFRVASRAATRKVCQPPLRERVKTHVDFVKTFVRSPRRTGSICPSSEALVSALVGAVPAADGLVIDLGAGTGIVTERLLNSGVPPGSVVAVECCKPLVKMLERKYANVLILGDDARYLSSLLALNRPAEPLRAVISSLPFRAMPKRVVDSIAWELRRTLAERGGCLIQYSYLWWLHYPLRRYGFTPQRRVFVFKNVPPAVVEVYTV